MPTVQSYTPGTFCWCEAYTNNQEAGKAFYAKVFGWTTSDSPSGPDSVYTSFFKGSGAVAGMSTLSAEQIAAGAPPHWGLYISVESVDDSTAKAQSLGATVLAPAFDIMDVGRMSVLQDPCGAVFSLWQKGLHFGADIIDEPGAFCWYELAVKDTNVAKEFYTQLFGWTPQDRPGYTEWFLGEERVGGMMSIPDVPPNWMPYVMVSDCDATAAAAQEAGGTLLLGPGAAGDMGRFCILLDPQGACFAIFQRVLQS